MTPAEAIEAAELTEAETRYRNQVGRLMYEAGRRRPRPRWPLSGPASPQWFAVRISPSSRPGAGDLAAVPISATRARATSPAAAPGGPETEPELEAG